jgi:two-component system response regulator AtoC/two-component system response regulator HupR/HoxA
VNGRARILVVDDEPDIVEALRSSLEGSLPVEVEGSFSALEALQAMRRRPADLVIADYRMPGMDGLHLLRRVQELRPEAARILMTAYADIGLVVEAVNLAKAARFLRKPLDGARVVALVREVLDEAAQERALRGGWPEAGGAEGLGPGPGGPP